MFAIGDRVGLDRHGVFRRLHTLRKAGKLPKLGVRAVGKPPRLPADDEKLLAQLVVEAVGSLGQRDRLPYAPEFDAVVQRFNDAAAICDVAPRSVAGGRQACQVSWDCGGAG